MATAALASLADFPVDADRWLPDSPTRSVAAQVARLRVCLCTAEIVRSPGDNGRCAVGLRWSSFLRFETQRTTRRAGNALRSRPLLTKMADAIAQKEKDAIAAR